MPEADGPLATLGRKLASRGLPSLSVLIAQIAGIEGYAEFREIVAHFLRDREVEIFHHNTPEGQIASFASYFEDRYFPLNGNLREGFVEGYDEVTGFIPVVCMGMSFDDYHEIASDWRPSLQLMTYLVTNPWEDGEDVVLAEACGDSVPKSLVQRISKIRLSPEDAHRLLNGTRYEALAQWADRLHHNTNNFFLDTDYEELWSGMPPDWCDEEVTTLTTQWQQAEVLERSQIEFTNWLEEDIPGRIKEVVKFIEEKQNE